MNAGVELGPWTVARAADGPRVVAFLRRVGADRRVLRDKTAKRRFYAWAKGGTADYYAIDRLLTPAGLHPSVLPDDVWVEHSPFARKDTLTDKSAEAVAGPGADPMNGGTRS